MENRFTKSITTNGQRLSFHFLKVFSNTGYRYMVTVVNNEQPYAFYLWQRDVNWNLIDYSLLPSWIQIMEEDFNQAIVEMEQKLEELPEAHFGVYAMVS
ncbi:MAG TPA: hypothetical protein VM888_13280 [Chitinophagaceae bacterium]|nr:hypothetical protein [Chitinophagaceae bacterium]